MGRSFKKLKVFTLAYSYLLEVYEILPLLPDFELRNVYQQLQRAATSIVLNIVEGASNRSNKVFLNHLQYSYGSAREVEVLIMIAYDLNYIEKELYLAHLTQLEHLKKSLYCFMKSIDKEIILSVDNFNLN